MSLNMWMKTIENLINLESLEINWTTPHNLVLPTSLTKLKHIILHAHITISEDFEI
jgi:hypothetical protein